MKALQKKGKKGFIVSAELILIATIVVIGMIVGLAAVRDALTAELHDIAEAIGSFDQSYNFAGFNDTNTNTSINASRWDDNSDRGLNNPGDAGKFGDDFNITSVTAAGKTEP